MARPSVQQQGRWWLGRWAMARSGQHRAKKIDTT